MAPCRTPPLLFLHLQIICPFVPIFGLKMWFRHHFIWRRKPNFNSLYVQKANSNILFNSEFISWPRFTVAADVLLRRWESTFSSALLSEPSFLESRTIRAASRTGQSSWKFSLRLLVLISARHRRLFIVVLLFIIFLLQILSFLLP